MKKIKRLNPSRPALWFFCFQETFWVLDSGQLPRQTLESLALDFDQSAPKFLMGYHQSLPCILVDLQHQTIDLPQGQWLGLRELMLEASEELALMAGRAWQVANFVRTHQFCGQCGNRMLSINWEVAAQCRDCGHRAYPRISPAVIMAVVKDDKILLAKNKRNRGQVYSVLAGFVEVGETLEQTVVREVKEETNITVKNVRYFGSQPWPFPHNMMIGYIADYDSGEIKIDEHELMAADWFSKDELPEIPGTHTIARQLIDHVLAK